MHRLLSQKVAMEKVVLAVFVQTHSYVPEGKPSHWAAPISQLHPALTTLPWICFSSLGIQGLRPPHTNHKSQQCFITAGHILSERAFFQHQVESRSTALTCCSVVQLDIAVTRRGEPGVNMLRAYSYTNLGTEGLI